MTTKVSTSLQFKCPVHGLESQVFCFRAFEIDNIGLWKKYTVIYIEVDVTTEEVLQYIDELNKKLVAAPTVR